MSKTWSGVSVYGLGDAAQNLVTATPGASGQSGALLQVGGYDGANMRAIKTDATGAQLVLGTLTNNNAAPAANNIGVLPALCNTSAPSFTNGDQTLLSVDT